MIVTVTLLGIQKLSCENMEDSIMIVIGAELDIGENMYIQSLFLHQSEDVKGLGGMFSWYDDG